MHEPRDMVAGDMVAGDVAAGDELPGFEAGPVSRLMLALYCGASGDHNALHVDIDAARAAGQPDVFAHGMLSMAWLGRVLTNWVPQHRIREFGVRFAALTHVGESLVCSGRVREVAWHDGERRAHVELTTRNRDGEVKLVGDAWVAT